MSDEMTLDELRLAIAERLGYRYYWYDYLGECHLRDLGVQNTSGMTTFEKRPDNVPINLEYVPDWPRSVAAANMLLDDITRRGWYYEFASGKDQVHARIMTDAETMYKAVGETWVPAISRAWLKATE